MIGSTDYTRMMQDEVDWRDIYIMLRPMVRCRVYAYHVQSWCGQENDIAEDIVQETVRKIIAYTLKVQRDDNTVNTGYIVITARQILADYYRRDCRFQDVDFPQEEIVDLDEEDDLVQRQCMEMIINSMLGGGNWLLKDTNKRLVLRGTRFLLQQINVVVPGLVFVTRKDGTYPFWQYSKNLPSPSKRFTRIPCFSSTLSKVMMA